METFFMANQSTQHKTTTSSKVASSSPTRDKAASLATRFNALSPKSQKVIANLIQALHGVDQRIAELRSGARA